MRDVRERTCVNKSRLTFQRLHQVRHDGVLHQHRHCPCDAHFFQRHGLSGAAVGDYDLADALAHIAQAGGQREDCHNLACHRDVEACPAREHITACVACHFRRVADTDIDLAQRPVSIFSYYLLSEASIDFDWYRLKAFAAHASGDGDPFDGTAEGFDAIFENPQFAGADTSFYIRQPIPLIGGGRVALSGRNAFLNSLRPSKEFGQSNFVNPGLILAGVGTDMDLTPTLRVSSNFNYLGFADTTVLEVARAQGPVDRELGLDASFALTWRPLAIQNVVARLSVAALLPGKGYEALFGDEVAYSVLGNVVLTY